MSDQAAERKRPTRHRPQPKNLTPSIESTPPQAKKPTPKIASAPPQAKKLTPSIESAPPQEYFVVVPQTTLGKPSTVQIVPPQPGTLWQAWRSIATDYSRKNIAGWAAYTTKRWVLLSLFVVALLSGIAGIASSPSQVATLENFVVLASHGATNGSAKFIAAHHFTTFVNEHFALFAALYGVLNFCVVYIENVFMSIFMASFMPKSLGTIKQRFQRNVKPFAIASVPFSIIYFVAQIPKLILQHIGTSPALNQSLNTAQLGVSELLIMYGFSISVQAMSVGSTLRRRTVFSFLLLTLIIAGVGMLAYIAIRNLVIIHLVFGN